MKRFFLLSYLFTLSIISVAQTVENIHVEPEGDNIKISYRIGGSGESQLYNVTLTCSMDGGLRFEPKTVIGDVGANIRGGRSYYTIIWDVFEDVDEVGEAEFFVRVDLISDLSETPEMQKEQRQRPAQAVTQTPEETKTRKQDTGPARPEDLKDEAEPPQFKRSLLLAYTGSSPSPYGIRFGTLRNWGVYGGMRFGAEVDDISTYVTFTPFFGLTKYVAEAGFYRLHAYGGIGLTIEYFESVFYETSDTYNTFTLDFGVTNVLGPVTLSLGLEYLMGYSPDVVFGIGLVF